MDDRYWIFQTSTTSILLIICFLAFHQLCHTHINDKERLNKAIGVAVVNFVGVILNVLIYSSYMYPNAALLFGFTVKETETIFEAFSMIIMLHVLVQFVLSIIDSLHHQLNITPPKYMKYLFYGMQIFVIIMVIICYSFNYIFNNIIWMHLFHITLGIVMFILAAVTFQCLVRLLRILSKVTVPNNTRIKSAKTAMIIGITITILIMIVCIADIWITIGILTGIFSVSMSFNNCIMHSLFIILISMALVLWIYQKYSFCKIDPDSFCMVWGCGDFWAFLCSCCCAHYIHDASSNNNTEQMRINAIQRQVWNDMYPKPQKKHLGVQLLGEVDDTTTDDMNHALVDEEETNISSITHNISDGRKHRI